MLNMIGYERVRISGFFLRENFHLKQFRRLFCLNFPVFLGAKFCQIFLQELLFGGKFCHTQHTFRFWGQEFSGQFSTVLTVFKLTFCQLTLNLV
jgi:hypothetical protein